MKSIIANGTPLMERLRLVRLERAIEELARNPDCPFAALRVKWFAA